jgi:hypothetical protein
MTARHTAAEHHASAAAHHEQGARYHREASRHYQIGKDYAHAAHQALVAHGHAMQAIMYGNEARKFYAEHNGPHSLKFPDPVPRCAEKSLEGQEAMNDPSSADHHTAAAGHHEQATKLHRQAAKHCEADDDASAVQEAHVAHGHAQASVFHGDEAAKHHVEHYGKSGPTAELS